MHIDIMGQGVVYCVALVLSLMTLGNSSVLLTQPHYGNAPVYHMDEWFASLTYRNTTCPCADQKLCNPVSKQHNKEVFVFSVEEANWKKYPFNWNVITTIAVLYATSPTFDPQMICYAHARNVRIVALVNFPKNQLTNDTARATWVKQMLIMAQTLFLDGVNLDFEEPISVLEVAEREGLTALTLELFSTFKTWSANTQVTFDTPIAPKCTYGRCYDYAALARYTDFLVLMGYDESGGHSPEANSKYDETVQGVIQFLSLGIPPKNLLLGLPWYGYVYPCSTISQNRTCRLKPPYGTEVNYNNIQALLRNHSTSGRQFDNLSLTPFFNAKSTSGDLLQVWYDDPESLAYKCVFARAASLRGVGTWHADTLDYSNTPEGRAQQSQMWGTFLKFNPV